MYRTNTDLEESILRISGCFFYEVQNEIHSFDFREESLGASTNKANCSLYQLLILEFGLPVFVYISF